MEGAHFRWQDGDLLLDCHAQPGARHSAFAEVHNQRLKLKIAAPPVDGKANEALIAFISREFGVRKREVVLEKGASSRQKRLRIMSPKVIPVAAQISENVQST